MGAGKSTVGKKLAMRLGLRFFDLDTQIAESMERSIVEIFEEDGEDAFRSIEAMALKNLSELDGFVMATGGGTPCFHRNMNRIKKSGRSFYLKADSAFLASRVGQSNTRPLLKGLSGEELKAKLDELLKERSAFYEQAKFTVEAKDLGAEQIEEMARMLGK